MALNEIEPKGDNYTYKLFDHMDAEELEKFSKFISGCLAKISAGEVKV